MVLRQYLHEEPAIGVSYLLACTGHGVSAVIDPVFGAAQYVEESARLGTEVRYVIDTHVHADHISTARELSEATGAAYVLWEGAPVAFPFTGVADGAVLEVGNTTLEVWHTPGHTPEHISLLVTDRTRGDEPWAVLTGHTLMVGDLGRTELASEAASGARALFGSAARLKQLPDHVEVLPGAYAGSVCGRGLSGKPWSTIGYEKRFNRALHVDDERAFIELMLRDVPARPHRAEEIRAQNAGSPFVAA